MSELSKLRQFVNDSPLPYTMKNKEKMKEKRFFDAYPEPEVKVKEPVMDAQEAEVPFAEETRE